MFEEVTIQGIDLPVILAGKPLEDAKAAVIMIHGRGASAQDILLNVPKIYDLNFAYLAPQAANNAWYPNPFTAPLQDNEPHLSSSLAQVANILTHITQTGIPPERTILFGFSQGACLALEFAARNPTRYGGVVGLSGGLIGPDDIERDDRGSLSGSPIFIGCSEVDPYIPKHRLEHASNLLSKLGGSVTLRMYPDMGHTVNEDELNQVRSLMTNIKF